MQAALPLFRAVLQQAVEAWHGEVFNLFNDTLQAAFYSVPDAIHSALQAQQAILAMDWDLPMRPRLALLTGSAQRQANEFLGPAPHRAARLLAVAHGGQVLLCNITADLARGSLPAGAALLDLGSHRLPDLTHPESIFQLTAPGLPVDFPPIKTLNNQSTNLPIQPNLLVGRQPELQAITQLLRSTGVRLVTLTGIGGTGKTRLALQSAADLLASFPDGVFFVSLDQLSDPALVSSAIASALPLDLSANLSIEKSIQAYLEGRHTLLVLDNFEHLLPAASLVSDLLAACPQLKILVTSREVLHLRSEHEFPVSPLSLPDPLHPSPPDQLAQFASVALFIQRAQAARPDFTVDSANAPAVAEICAFLDGLPLAIELAAARVRMFSPQTLLARLKAQPNLQLLSSGPRDQPVRQQTLQNALAWSYDLLNPTEQALFRRLGVFSGGFTPEAVKAVCYPDGEQPDDVFAGLASLLEKSMIRRSEDGAAQIRFSMLFVLRQFALGSLQQLGELPVFQARHAAYFVSFAEQIEPLLNANDQTHWCSVLERDHDNLREALSWSISNQKLETALRLSGSLILFWTHRSYLREGRLWLQQALSLPNIQEVAAPLHAKALRGAGWATRMLGDHTSARRYYEQYLELCRKQGNRQEIASGLGLLGYQMICQGDYQPGVQHLEESIAIYRELGDQIGLARSLDKLAVQAMNQCEFSHALTLLDESLSINRSHKNLEGIAITLGIIGSVEYYRGNLNLARELLEENYQMHKALGQEFYVVEALVWLGAVHLQLGNLLIARKNFEEVIKDSQKNGVQSNLPDALEGLAGIALKSGHVERVARILGATEELRRIQDNPIPPASRVFIDGLVDGARSLMKKDEFSAAWSAGREMLAEGLDKVIAFALEPGDLSEQRSSKSANAGLTTREAEILRLLAHGLADAQIAEKLFISPRTVNAHLTSIYSKLGVNSRAAATRFAVDNGLA